MDHAGAPLRRDFDQSLDAWGEYAAHWEAKQRRLAANHVETPTAPGTFRVPPGYLWAQDAVIHFRGMLYDWAREHVTSHEVDTQDPAAVRLRLELLAVELGVGWSWYRGACAERDRAPRSDVFVNAVDPARRLAAECLGAEVARPAPYPETLRRVREYVLQVLVPLVCAEDASATESPSESSRDSAEDEPEQRAEGSERTCSRELSPLERDVLRTLERLGKPTIGEVLLRASGVSPESGSNRKTLADMVKAGLLDNRRGQGYLLPEWVDA